MAATAPQGIGKTRFSTKTVAVITLGLVMVLFFLVFFSHRGIYQIYRLKQEKAHLDMENQKLFEDNARLARSIDRLHNDPEMIQDLIRRSLNYVKKNEIVIQLPHKDEGAPVKAAALPDRPPPAAKEGTEKHRPRGQSREVLESQKHKP